MKIKNWFKSGLYASLLIMSFAPKNSLGQASVNTFAFSGPANLPSQDAYSAQFLVNVEQGMQSGNWPVGSSSTPAYANPITSGNVSVAQTIATPSSFSWNGSANVSGTFAGEHGQLLLFGAMIKNPLGFSLNQVVWWLTFPSDKTTNSGTLSGVGYSQIGIGINWGADGIPGTADDTTYTSGNGGSLVNEVLILYSGWGMSAGLNETPQNSELDFKNTYGNSRQIIGGYSLGGVSASQTINVQAVPKPPQLKINQIIQAATNQMAIGWSAVAGEQYQLQANNDLKSTNWFNVGGLINTTLTNFVTQIPMTNTMQFYRVVQSP